MTSHDQAPGQPRLTADESPRRAAAPSATRPWALVTGASGGIGEAFVDHLSQLGTNVVLVARSVDKLETVADRVRSRGVEALVLPCDVSDRAARQALLDDLAARDIEVDTLVNNAGFGMLGQIAEQQADKVLQMVEVNCAALTHFTVALLPGMVERRRGTIINVASTASFQPIPGMAAYAATKSFVRIFTEGLWGELKGTGVRAIALCPGPTETGFFDAAEANDVLTRRRTPEQVVQTCFKGLSQGRPTITDGALNVAQSVAPRFVPTRVAAAISAAVVRRH